MEGSNRKRSPETADIDDQSERDFENWILKEGCDPSPMSPVVIRILRNGFMTQDCSKAFQNTDVMAERAKLVNEGAERIVVQTSCPR